MIDFKETMGSDFSQRGFQRLLLIDSFLSKLKGSERILSYFCVHIRHKLMRNGRNDFVRVFRMKRDLTDPRMLL